jgi:hypothetical protein
MSSSARILKGEWGYREELPDGRTTFTCAFCGVVVDVTGHAESEIRPELHKPDCEHPAVEAHRNPDPFQRVLERISTPLTGPAPAAAERPRNPHPKPKPGVYVDATATLALLIDMKALWDQEGFGTDPQRSEPLYNRLNAAIEEIAEKPRSRVDPLACCAAADFLPCGCAVAFRCPIHGDTHRGTHD